MDLEFGCYLIAALLLWWWVYKPHRGGLKRAGLTCLGLGFLIFLLEVFLTLLSRGGTLSVFQILASTAVGLFYLVLLRFRRWDAVKIAPLVASVAFLFSLLGLKVGSFGWNNTFVFLHVVVSVFAFTLLVLSALFSLLRYVAERKLKRGQLELPLSLPVELWARLERSFFFFGFIFLTLELIFNFIWLKVKVGVLLWDSRIVATLLLWFYYWLLFHLDRWGISFVKRHFAVLNTLGALLLVVVLVFTRHRV